MKNKGCVSCHSTDGKTIVGPSFKAIYGTEVAVLTQGQERTVKIDDDYIRRSIQQPMLDIVKGFPPSMPPQNLTETEIMDVTDYIKSLK
jgi:cytochrome c oxidase subunit 2